MGATAFPQELLVRIRGNSAEVEAAGKRASAALANVGTTAARVGSTSGSAAANLRRMEGPLRTIAGQALGANPALLGLSSVIGSFALSGPVMIGALAGLAALGLLWEHITAGAKAAKKAQEEAIQPLLDLARKRELGILGELLPATEAARAQMFNAQRGIARIEKRKELHFGRLSEDDQAELAALKVTYAAKAKMVKDGETEMQRIQTEKTAEGFERQVTAAQESLAAQKKAGEDRVREMAARLKELNELVVVEGAFFERSLRAWRIGNVMRGGVSAPGARQLDDSQPLLPFGMRIESMSGSGAAALQRHGKSKGLEGAAEEFDEASNIAIASFGAMAQAAVAGSAQMEQSIVSGLTNILQAMDFAKAGPWGAVLGVVGGLVGSLLGRGSRSDPLPVRIQQVDPQAARDMQPKETGPQHVTLQLISSTTGEVTKQVEYNLRRRTARDAVERIPPGVTVE